MTKRLEFSKPTKRQALRRSGHYCEAHGPEFDLSEGERCNMPLSNGVEFHHDKEATFGGDNSLENCLAVCIGCHRLVTAKRAPVIAKNNRQRDKNMGIRKRQSRPMAGSRQSKWKRKLDGTVVLR